MDCRYVGRGRGRFLCTLQRAAWCIRALALRFFKAGGTPSLAGRPSIVGKGGYGGGGGKEGGGEDNENFLPAGLGTLATAARRVKARRGKDATRNSRSIVCVLTPPSPTVIPCPPYDDNKTDGACNERDGDSARYIPPTTTAS